MKKHYNANDDLFIATHFGKMGNKELAEVMGRTVPGIRKHLRKLGYYRQDRAAIARVKNCEKKAKVYELYVSGLTVLQISKKLNYWPKTVHNWIKSIKPYTGNNPVTITRKSRI